MSYSSMLSQDEVDALLAGVTGEHPAHPPQDTVMDGVRPYDLGSPDRVVRHRMHTLELINERFARRLRSTMLSFMRRNADITVGSIHPEILRFRAQPAGAEQPEYGGNETIARRGAFHL